MNSAAPNFRPENAGLSISRRWSFAKRPACGAHYIRDARFLENSLKDPTLVQFASFDAKFAEKLSGGRLSVVKGTMNRDMLNTALAKTGEKGWVQPTKAATAPPRPGRKRSLFGRLMPTQN